MNIKRIINTALCAAIASGGVLSNSATPVMASNDSDSTLLTYEVTEKYTWTAPASFEVTESSNGAEVITGTVNVTENIIGDKKELAISVKSDQVYELTDVKNPNNKRAYTVKKGDTVINAGDTVLKVASGVNTGSVDLDFQLDAVDTETAGNYSGTTGFVANVVKQTIVDGVNVILNDKDGNKDVSKGDVITFSAAYLYGDESSISPTEFTVLGMDDTTVELMSIENYQTAGYGGSNIYNGSPIDTLMNETYYNELSDAVKARVVTHAITQYSWSYGGGTSNPGAVETYDRNVYVLDFNDVKNYLDGSATWGDDLNTLFFGTAYTNRSAWTRSSYYDYTTTMGNIWGERQTFSHTSFWGDAQLETHPAFMMDLGV